jgi:hypothetical protein
MGRAIGRFTCNAMQYAFSVMYSGQVRLVASRLAGA